MQCSSRLCLQQDSLGTGDLMAQAELIQRQLGANVDGVRVSEALAHLSLREAEVVERLVAEAHVPTGRLGGICRDWTKRMLCSTC